MPEIKTTKSAKPSDIPPKRNTNVKTDAEIKREERIDGVNGIFQLAGFGCIMTGQFADAGAIEMHGNNISNEIVTLAESNAGIAKGVDMLLQVGPYAGLVTAAMPLVLQFLVNHNVLPAEKMAGFNVVRPEVLESQVKTILTKQAMEAMKAQREAENELAEMQQEMMASQNGATNNN